MANSALAVKAPAHVLLAPGSHMAKSHYSRVEKSSPTVCLSYCAPGRGRTGTFVNSPNVYHIDVDFFSSRVTAHGPYHSFQFGEGEFCPAEWNFSQTTEYCTMLSQLLEHGHV